MHARTHSQPLRQPSTKSKNEEKWNLSNLFVLFVYVTSFNTHAHINEVMI